MKAKILKIMFVSAIVLFAASSAQADGGCNFYRDLGQGSRGEDVRCLQQYLGNPSYGASYGFLVPDGSFGPMTRQALMSWQASNGVFPATGYFDAASRNKYFELVSFGGMTVVGEVLGVSYDSNLTYGYGSQEQIARQKIQHALIAIEDARDEDDDSGSLDDAEENILVSMRAFFIERNFSKAGQFADNAFNDAQDALDDGHNGDREDAEDLIDEVDENINDAQDDINAAARAGRNVTRANDLLDDARDTLEDAEDEFDDKDYDEAEDLAEEADELVDDALDEIGSSTVVTRDSAWNAIEDAQDAIDDAEDEIDDADDDGEDVDEAEELLEDAQDKLDDAEDAFDAQNYNRAKDLAEDAEELADDAVDELN